MELDLALLATTPADATVTDANGSPGGGALGPPLSAGSVLGGRYRIAGFIAAGGMGEVYQATDSLLGGEVAVKLLRTDLLRKPGAQERFADEIRIARKVTHPNVCRVFDVGVDGERVFYTMELHDGETLARYLARTGPLDVATASPLARQILAGVGAAHAVDVVHADLKPSNVLLAGNDHKRVLVTDFGLAMPCCATLACRCDMPHLVGTPAYMAPEQVTGGTILDGTDLFSFGVILFEMMTGALPWRGATALELAHARLDGDVPSPRALRADLDPRWDAVILACLSRDITQRPRSVAAIAASLGLT